MPAGIATSLDAVHEGDLGRVFQLEEVQGLGAAEVVFAGDRAAQFNCERGESIIGFFRFSGSLHRMARCTLPSPACPQPAAAPPASVDR
jgi:hypothetical protein